MNSRWSVWGVRAAAAVLCFGCTSPTDRKQEAASAKQTAASDMDAKLKELEQLKSAGYERSDEMQKLRLDAAQEKDPKRKAELTDRLRAMERETFPSASPRPACTCASTDPTCDCL